ncbi:MAG: 50S ribosomal protein L18 [Deltaproteobacteria bacterium]|jgi:large subunit ribosomal protein L18|nr:50S ribosomal protein L18 [Deltaproteobacteria bacterium]
MSPKLTKKDAWCRRKKRVRKKVTGGHDLPRLNVYKSNKHIYVQIIDDTSGHTSVCASTLSPELKGASKYTGNVEAAKKVGGLIAKKCLEKKIDRVVFDRNGFLYHGRIKALAQSAREGGLKF